MTSPLRDAEGVGSDLTLDDSGAVLLPNPGLTDGKAAAWIIHPDGGHAAIVPLAPSQKGATVQVRLAPVVRVTARIANPQADIYGVPSLPRSELFAGGARISRIAGSRVAVDLPPGEYRLEAIDSSQDGVIVDAPPLSRQVSVPAADDVGTALDLGVVALPSGRVAFAPGEPNLAHAGDGSVRIRLVPNGGASAASLPWVLRRHGHREAVAYGRSNGEGLIALDGLVRAGRGQPYFLEIGDWRGGTFWFEEGEESVSTEVQLPPLQGSLLPGADVRRASDGQLSSIGDIRRGRALYVQFWATWDPSSQAAIADVARLAASHADDWDGTLCLLALNVDRDDAAWRRRLEGAQWPGFEHAWCPAPPDGGRSVVESLLGVGRPRTAFLVDRDGVVRWRGLPGDVDLRGRIGALLAPADPPKAH